MAQHLSLVRLALLTACILPACATERLEGPAQDLHTLATPEPPPATRPVPAPGPSAAPGRWRAWVPPQTQAEGSFVQATTYPKIPVGTWNLLAPRAAVAWDLTGAGRTVMKATYGWYNQELEYQATQFASSTGFASTQ